MEIAIQAAIIGAIIGSLLAGWLSYSISKKGISTTHENAIALINKQEFFRAANKFREAFIFELDFLKYGEASISSIHGTAYDVLTQAYKAHRIAYETFRLDLPQNERISFDKSWKDYLYPTGHNKSADYPLLEYAEGKEEEKRQLAHDKISNLLIYARIG